MFTPLNLFIIVLFYLCLLFSIAYYAEQKEKKGKSIVNNPYIYSLSLAVYCTSWTFYGSVGKAATSGISFLPVYLGPTLIAALWLVVLKKTVRIAKTNKITTLSDFISSRYGKSLLLSALITIIAAVGITPYLGLQMKAIMSSFALISGKTTGSPAIGLFITLTLGAFAIIFGARRLDVSERHGGLVCAIAFESIVKLISFMLVGIFVTFTVFNGFSDIFTQVKASEYGRLLLLGEKSGVDYAEWFGVLFLSMMAILFLPRQFYMTVVENHDEAHLTKAAWLFPLYLFLINIFVLPIAFGGLLTGLPEGEADYFVLSLPLRHGVKYLSLFAFIGGFSAAIGMVIVEALALSTMIMNSIIIPVFMRFRAAPQFPKLFLNIKRLVILGLVFLGYLFAHLFGEFYSLVDIGLKSFEMVSLFAPAFFLGLYWKKGTKAGAIAGLIVGFIVLVYTLILPALIRAGLIENAGIIASLTGTELLSPEHLFGVRGFGKWSHSLFWSALLNLVFYIGVSVFTGQSREEQVQSLIFVESYEKAKGFISSGSYSVNDIKALLVQYLGKDEAEVILQNFLVRKGKGRDDLTPRDLFELREEAEKALSGAIGSPIAAVILENRLCMTEKEREALSASIRQITESLRHSHQELAVANRELSYLKEFNENIIESASVGIVNIGPQLRIEYWNREMETITGVVRAEALDRPVLTLLPWIPDDVFRTDTQKELTLQTQELQTFKLYISPLKHPTGGFVVIIENISETRRLERERKNILSMFAHDMKNPVMTAGGFLSRLLSGKDGTLSDAQRTHLSLVSEELAKLQELITDFLEFSRFEAKECKPVSCLFDLAKVLSQHIESARIEADKKRITIKSDYLEDIPLLIRADERLISRVLTNLLDNAVKYTESEGAVTVRLLEREMDIFVQVADNGIGIPENHLPYIFDAFYRVSRDSKGSGLGLSIVKTIIDAHGGRIWVESASGKGTAMNFTLPR